MNKYLEALKQVYYGSQGYGETDKYYKYLKEYLESIDNAEPSEAFGLIKRTCELYADSLKQRNLIGYDIIEKQINEALDTIKQALLKAQEPKQYLKWEDLKFKEEEQIMKVSLNGSKYQLSYFTDGITEYVDLLTDGEKLEIIGRYVDANSHEKQFFNDLHLELVE